MGFKKIADCGIYTVLGLTRMLDDQEKCDGKAKAAMQLCTQTEGAYYGYYDMSDEIMKAEAACHEHAKIVGCGSQLQTQTWDGF
jgi:hypothetical protein